MHAVVTMVRRTRSKVSRKSEIKAQRKEAAKAYKSPNGRFQYDPLFFAAIYRERMLEAKSSLLLSCGSREIAMRLRWFLMHRRDYKQRLQWAREDRLGCQMPLP